ncbi:hypothetical protein Musp01_26620 [Muricauda sp. NBRC 101325]|nr:hypothetical protein Musp01_26620 [Muricauda sp. NBRC 101325]
MLNYAVKKTSEKFGQQFGNYEDSYRKETREGETTVDKKPFTRKSNPSKKVGEYIDFEEID